MVCFNADNEENISKFYRMCGQYIQDRHGDKNFKTATKINHVATNIERRQAFITDGIYLFTFHTLNIIKCTFLITAN